MRHLTGTLLPLAVASLAITAAPRDAIAKCLETAGVEILPGYSVIVDGSPIGEFAMEASPPLPPSAEIYHVVVECRDVRSDDSGVVARQASISVVTRSGLLPLLESYLRALVEAQRMHYSRAERYAQNLSELRVSASPASVPIEVTVSDTGWTASATVESLDTVCQVSVGSAEPSHPELSSGVPGCFSMD